MTKSKRMGACRIHEKGFSMCGCGEGKTIYLWEENNRTFIFIPESNFLATKHAEGLEFIKMDEIDDSSYRATIEEKVSNLKPIKDMKIRENILTIEKKLFIKP